MIKYEDECVGCPKEMGCLGNSCPNLNVERHYCDSCGDDATLNIDEQDFCDTCAELYLCDIFRALGFEDKVSLLEVDVKKLDN